MQTQVELCPNRTPKVGPLLVSLPSKGCFWAISAEFYRFRRNTGPLFCTLLETRQQNLFRISRGGIAALFYRRRVRTTGL